MNKYLIPFLITVLVAQSCSNKKNSEHPTPIVLSGPVTEQEIASIAPPTYQQVIDAYNEVTTKDPTLIANEELLGRAIFNYIKSHLSKTASLQNNDIKIQSIFDVAAKLTFEEWKIVVLQPNNTYKAFQTVSPSSKAARDNYPCDSDVGYEDSKADAVRHAYWNALMVKRTDNNFAEKMATAHETEPSTPLAKEMDLHNNIVGRELVKKYPEATEDELLKLLVDQKFIYLNDGDPVPEDKSVLVYLKAKRSFDGTFSGSITNPDSGGPWNVTFDLNQCDNIIRGQMIFQRGGESQKRRFNGTLSSSKVTLIVAEPYAFENPTGLTPCSNMLMLLSGNQNSLSGNWSSSNCALGGVVNISK